MTEINIKHIFRYDDILSDDTYAYRLLAWSNVDNPAAVITLDYNTDVFELDLSRSILPDGTFNPNTNTLAIPMVANVVYEPTFFFKFIEPENISEATYEFNAEISGLDTNESNNFDTGKVIYKRIISDVTMEGKPSTGGAYIDVRASDSLCNKGTTKWNIIPESLSNTSGYVWENGQGAFTYNDITKKITGEYVPVCVQVDGTEVSFNPVKFELLPLTKDLVHLSSYVSFVKCSDLSVEEIAMIADGVEGNDRFPGEANFPSNPECCNLWVSRTADDKLISYILSDCNPKKDNKTTIECIDQSYTDLENCNTCADPSDKVTFPTDPQETDIHIAHFAKDNRTVYYQYIMGETGEGTWVEKCKTGRDRVFQAYMQNPINCEMVYLFTVGSDLIHEYPTGDPYTGDVTKLIPYTENCGNNAGVA